ncbi:hypothetical protein MPSEU_000857400 [Mayamaea pseudoterrestris]|nr:hypothetical protein MPSEU_000857400 [Mayamaea pseudoterrestris]
MKRMILPHIFASFVSRSSHFWKRTMPITRTSSSHVIGNNRSNQRLFSSAVDVDKDVQLMEDILYRVRQVNYMPPHIQNDLFEFRVENKSLGKIRPKAAELLCKTRVDGNAIFQVAEEQDAKPFVTLTNHAGNSFESRSAAVAGVTEQLRRDGVVKGWRDELYPIKEHFYMEPLFAMERAAVPMLGALEYGVHINGIVKTDNGETKMWLARRSPTKSKYPGMLDHIVAGGVPHGVSLFDNVIKECMEEAGIPESVTRDGVRSAGAISYETYSRAADTVTRAVLFCYDLTLPQSFAPMPVDGEVEEFFLVSIEQLKAMMAKTNNDPIKPNCYSVIIDYLLREGHLSPEIPGYLDVIRELRSGDCS